MSEAGASRVAPGWYPDPEQPAAWRYWDGSSWGERRTGLSRPPLWGALVVFPLLGAILFWSAFAIGGAGFAGHGVVAGIVAIAGVLGPPIASAVTTVKVGGGKGTAVGMAFASLGMAFVAGIVVGLLASALGL